jgi:hypothetical protein
VHIRYYLLCPSISHDRWHILQPTSSEQLSLPLSFKIFICSLPSQSEIGRCLWTTPVGRRASQRPLVFIKTVPSLPGSEGVGFDPLLFLTSRRIHLRANLLLNDLRLVSPKFADLPFVFPRQFKAFADPRHRSVSYERPCCYETQTELRAAREYLG